MAEQVVTLPEGVERVILWTMKNPFEQMTATHFQYEGIDHWTLSGRQGSFAAHEVTALIGSEPTTVLVREKYPRPTTEHEWELAKNRCYIQIEAQMSGWLATVYTPGLQWFDNNEYGSWSRGEQFSRHSHDKREKALEKALKSQEQFKLYCDRSKQNTRV